MLPEEEKTFYEKYRWALQPFLSFRQITERLRALVEEDISSEPGWCRHEWNINLYMLSSAAADIADDFMVKGVPGLSKMTHHFPFMGIPVGWFRDAMAFARTEGSFTRRGIRIWRGLWSEWLLSICGPLVQNRFPGPLERAKFKEELVPLLHYPFPAGLRDMRTRIPAAFRSQDLTHHDFLALARKYAAKCRDVSHPHVILGLRTAGSFGAPLVHAHLLKEGFSSISRMTIRPKEFLHPWEKARIKKLSGAHVIIVDEPPSTGQTLAKCIEIIRHCGATPRSVTIMVPLHPACRNWPDPSARSFLGDAQVLSLEPGQWYKEGLLSPDGFRICLSSYFQQMGFDCIKVRDTEYTKNINKKLAQNPDRVFHSRLKRVFEVEAKKAKKVKKNEKNATPPERFVIMAKSIGWGWLGYHAAIAASRIERFIPRVYGVRNGLMYIDWAVADIGARPHEINSVPVERLASYISARTNGLRLDENPMPQIGIYRESGLKPVALMLSKAFGHKLSKLKREWVRGHLDKLECPVPALLDARMAKEEWVNTGPQLLKTDFEHHGFSKTASHNITDPAYDIASAMLEFGLSEVEKGSLIGNYIASTGDASVNERLIYYKLLAGDESMSKSLGKLNGIDHNTSYQDLNLKYLRSWNFLVNETARYTASLCEGTPVRDWDAPIFSMDVDDVLDKNIFGFPCTTGNGIAALSMLRAHGVCAIINTARSLEEVKDYCRHYGFPGAIAEYGSVIWDDIEQWAKNMVPPEALEELDLLRSELGRIPGLFINPRYHYSIRAYSFGKERTAPIPDATVGELMRRLKIRHLKVKKSYIDTAFIAVGVDKGSALLVLKELKGIKRHVGAAGDTEADLPMLVAASQGFLVNNSSPELKKKARRYGIRTLGSSFQAGLLDAVNIFLHGTRRNNCKVCSEILKKLSSKPDLLLQILRVPDMKQAHRLFSSLSLKALEAFKD